MPILASTDLSPPPTTEHGRLLILSAAVLWSLAGVFIKFLDVHPLTIVFYRSLFASLVFVPFLRSKNWRLSGPVVISVLSYTAAISAFVSANKLTTAANAIVLQYTAPIFVFVFSRLVMGEKISRLNGLALFAGMLGVGVISFDSAGQPEMAGVVLALLSGILFAVYMINLPRTKEINTVYLTWINNFVCALVLLSVVSSRLLLSRTDLLLLAVMGTVQLGLPYFLFSKGLRTVSLQEAALIALVEPVLNPLWVALVVDEIPSAATLVGGGMILLGLGVRYVWPMLIKPTRSAQSESRT
ncbi:MAG TPA: EamA family transporter [Candidatus Binatia bacterium]|nr:EamA family transporter [Candidatus Binatia bacterium]